jgi:peptidyl-prolyl cis-trans isomerase D
MISWLQTSFQRHFKWLFLLLLGVVIVSFVFMDSSGGMGLGGDNRQPPRPFFGLDLSLATDQRQLAEDARLSVFLRFNPSGDVSDSELSNYALNRHATLALADRLGLPAPTPEQLLAHIRAQRAFADPATGNFDPKRYAEFTDSISRNPRLTEGDVSRVITADARLVAYEKLVAGPGFVLPSDIAGIIAARDTVWTLAVAEVDGSAFAPRIDTSDTALAAWFETNARRYEIPPRVSVAALRVPAAPATPIDADNAPSQSDADRAALAAASDLSVRLFETNTRPADLAAFVASVPDIELVEIGAVGANAIPAELGGPSARTIATEALRLSADRPYSNPVAIPGGAAILVWRENIPARIPALEEVRDRALADYQLVEKRRLFNETGRSLQATVSAAIAGGKTFEAAVTAASDAAGLKASVRTPEPFSLSANFPRDLDYAVLTSLESLSKGKVGDFLPVAENSGRLVYVIEQIVPTLDPASAEYARIREEFASTISQTNAAALISGIVEAELSKTAFVVE